MPIVADAAVAVRGDLSKFNQDLKGADKGVQGLGARLKGALTPTGILAGAGIALGGAQVISFLSDATNAAAEFQDTVSATGVIMGEEAVAGLEEWAEKAAEAFGASKQDALAAANQMAVFGKSAGLVGDDLTEFSTSLTQLGGDLASMFGGSTQDAITAVGAALRGESEPIRRYGVLLDDATLRQKAFEMGLVDTINNALTPQQRVLAAQAEIMEQTADAQGDFARTSDGMANTQRTLAAEMENVTIEIGEKLLPVMLDLANFVRDVVVPAISLLSDWFIGPIAQGIASVIDGITQFIDTVTGIPGAVGDVVGAFGDFVTGAEEAEQAVGESMTQVNNNVAENMGGVVQTMQETAGEVRREAQGIAGIVPQEISNRWADTRQAAFQMAIEHAKGILDGQNQVKVAFEVLTQLQEEEQTRAQRISYLNGLLNSQELQAGLNDGRPGVRGAANALRAEIEAELRGLNAYQWGYNTGATLAQGLTASGGLVDGAARGVASLVGRQIQIESEPPDPTSPLRGITKWGGNIVKTIAEGMYGNLGLAGGAAYALAGSLTPGFPGASPVSIGSGGGGGGNTYQVYVESLPEHPTLRDIGGELKRLGEMGKLPGAPA